MATGALALAISAIFATKANKRFLQVQTAIDKSGDYIFKAASTLNILTTAGASLHCLKVELVTALAAHQIGAYSQALFTAVHQNDLVKFK